LAQEAILICEISQLKNQQVLAEAMLLLASAHEEQGRSDSSAYYYYLLGNQIENGVNIQAGFAVELYTKLAIFWLNLYYGSKGSKEYQDVLTSYVQRARMAARQMTDKEDAITSTYFLEGAYHHALQDFDSARYYYNAYLNERDAKGIIGWRRKVSCYVNIAQSYLDQKSPEEALVNLDKAKLILETPSALPYSQYFDSYTKIMYAEAFYQQKKYEQSINLIETTLLRLSDISEKVNLNVVEAYNIAALSYQNLGNLKQALFYKDLYISLHDSLIKRENLNMINGMEVRYRMVEKDKELAESRLDVAAAAIRLRNRNQVIGLSLVIIVGGLLFFYLWSRKKEDKSRLQRERLDNILRTQEIDRLTATISGEEVERSRIARELHDGVGGLLSAAKMNLELFEKKIPFVDRSDLNEGISLLQVASSELRKTAHNLMPEILMQEGLVKAIQHYCASLSAKNSPLIQVQVLGDKNNLSSPIEFSVYRIVQELVHNMVRHSKATEGLVELNYRTDGGLSLTVEDNGTGLFEQDDESKHDGIGLRNVKQRIKAIDGHLDIKSSPGNGTSFYIEFDAPAHNAKIEL